jgi:hypothetical protein
MEEIKRFYNSDEIKNALDQNTRKDYTVYKNK